MLYCLLTPSNKKIKIIYSLSISSKVCIVGYYIRK